MRTLAFLVALYVIAATAIVLPPQKGSPKLFIGSGTGAVTNTIARWVDPQFGISGMEVWVSTDVQEQGQLYAFVAAHPDHSNYCLYIAPTNLIPGIVWRMSFTTNADTTITTNFVPVQVTNSYGFVRVRSRDYLGNVSDWGTTATNILPLQ